MAQSKSQPKHKAATEVTIVHEEKSPFAAFVGAYWPHMAIAATVVGAVVIFNDYSDKQVVEDRRAEWDILVNAAASGDAHALMKISQAELANTGIEGWAALAAVSPFLAERDYAGALEAVGAIEASSTPLLTDLSLPIGKEGAETTIANALKAGLASQQAQDLALGSIFENAMPPRALPWSKWTWTWVAGLSPLPWPSTPSRHPCTLRTS